MKVSVIIPVYKVEKYLDECVSSVVDQTYKNLEIILVDDGSPDSCPTMCDKWAEKDSRIKVIHKENGGAAHSRNAGLDIATGDYILFVDSDDILAATAVEELMSVRDRQGADIVVFDYCRQLEELGTGSADISALSSEQALIKIVRHTNYIVPWGKLMKKELFDLLRFENGRLNEDEFFCHHIFHNAQATVEYNKKLYYYRETAASLMTSKFKMKNLVDTMDAIEGRLAFLKENGYEKAYHANIARLFTGFFSYYPDIKPTTAEEKFLKKKYKQRIKSILPQLRNHPQLIEKGYKFIVAVMHISVDLGMWIVKMKRRFFKFFNN